MARVPSYQNNLSVNQNSEGIISPINRNRISYPQVLDPEQGPQTVHRPDLYFVNSTHSNSPRQNTEPIPRTSTISNQLYPYHQQGFHHYSPPMSYPFPQDPYLQNQPPPPPPPIYKTNGSPLPPALPPKPIVYPDIGSNSPRYDQRPYAGTSSSMSPPREEDEFVLSPTDLALALAMSQSESVERQKQQELLQNQEEEDLARALAESLLSSGSNLSPPTNSYFPQMAGSSEATVTGSQFTPSTSYENADLPIQNNNILSEQPFFSPVHYYPKYDGYHKGGLSGTPDNILGSSQSSYPPEDYGKRLNQVPHMDPSPLPPSRDFLSVETSPRPRSISVSSISSLPYTRSAPDTGTLAEQESDSRPTFEPEAQENEGYPSGPSVYGSPELPSHISSAIWTTAQPSEFHTEADANVLEFDDEAYARQLAAEEEAMAAQEQTSLYPNEKARPMPIYNKDIDAALPSYTPGDSKCNYYASSKSPVSPAHSGPSVENTYPSLVPGYIPANLVKPKSTSSAYDFSSSATGSYSSPVVYPTLGHQHEPDVEASSEVSHHSSYASSPQTPQSANRRVSGASSNEQPRSTTSAAPSASQVGMLNANHFVDRDLLVGVSIGFKPPAISKALTVMEEPMPNIISLPYARCPPLHLQAPNWRHLLRLMARLSGTRIEPTVEALAINKNGLKLRTVVQFIKPYQHSNDWRTILWFTIDHPVPPAVPGAFRYQSGNPNLLPWSYTLSPVPMLLRDAADTQLSKTYTIPATESVPLPNLPITFPNLALYLQAALDESRARSGDSSGFGKLGKVVHMCYPNMQQAHSEFDLPEKSKMTDMFKRVMKRSNKDKKKGKASNNEETYQLVTPFVPEWG